MIVFAHAGHWLPQLLYLAPVLAVVVAVAVGRVKERRARRLSAQERKGVREATNGGPRA